MLGWMAFPARYAILLDGEFVKKVLEGQQRRFPTKDNVLGEVQRISAVEPLAALELYRIFYYTAEPLSGTATHPIGGTTFNFGATPEYSRNKSLIDQLENQPNSAVRRGALAHQGWEIGRAALRALTAGEKTTVEANDVRPKIQQKGVDMRIRLDIASMAFKRLVSAIVLVSGDSDLVPALNA